MAVNFDEQQLDAINKTNTSILVSASAGAGKTGVLVARLMKRCVIDRVPIQNILAVTFTEAAAGEIKKRLASNLHARMKETDDPNLLAYLNDQLIQLDAANITTIDSYCLSIIQKYYNVIGLDPAAAANVLSEGAKEALQEDAYLACYDELFHTDPTMAVKLASWFSPRSEDYTPLYEAVKSINSCADSVMEPDAWYDKVISFYPAVSNFADFPEEIMDSFFLSFELELGNISSDLQLMKQCADEDEKIKPETLEAKANALVNCLNAVKEHNYSSYCLSLDHLAELNTSPSTKNKKYTALRDGMNKKVKKLLSQRYTEKQYVDDAKEMSTLVKALVTLARNSRERFHAYKLAQACIDFSDMERYALDILVKNNGTVAGIIRDSLQEIMIDEFQDTSELQNAIIEKIAKKDNVFRVGDVKQSIYAFRQAKPSLMRSLMNNPENHLITLRHNFRSKDSIVHFTNQLFERIMNVPGACDTYSEEDHVTIGSEERQAEPAPVPVVFAQIDEPSSPENTSSDDDSESTDAEEESPSSKELKSAWIAQKIIELRKEDPSLKYNKFAVLTRSHTDKLYLKRAFDHANIPYDIDTRAGFYQSELCQTILSMCSVMCDPTDTISLLSVLTSSFYHISDEELAQIRIRHSSMREGIQAEHPEVLQEMKELYEIAEQHGVIAMLSEIANRHDFFDYLDDSQKANFDFLFEQTVAAKPVNLAAFLENMTVSEDERSSEAMSKGKDDDVVTVTTIHHSKGLQYEIVFLWSTAKNAFQDARSAVLVDEELGLGIKHLDLPWRAERPTVQRIAVHYKKNLEDLEEFTRLVYVALTRAERRLFIVDTLDKEFPQQPITLSLLNARKGMTGLILPALEDNPYFKHIHVQPDMSLANMPYARPGKDSLPHFEMQEQLQVETMTPSSTEFSSLPELDLQSEGNGTVYGTEMHAWAAKLPDTVWTMEDLKEAQLSDHDKQNLLDFAHSDLYQACLAGEIHKEYPFYIEQDVLHMNGIMDFVSIFPDHIILIDFKTDNASLMEIKNRYHMQLNAYRHALQVIYPNRPVTAYAWSFHNSDKIEIEE